MTEWMTEEKGSITIDKRYKSEHSLLTLPPSVAIVSVSSDERIDNLGRCK